jgi:predicted dehydrogenase/threonine dehydrogenase-like Zn-dependent dehydrogenase
MAGVRMSGLPLYQRALRQPENVKRVIEMVRDQGIARTVDRVTGKLAAGSPTGYSASGVVVDIGVEVDGFSIGDRVACAGAGIANHAEFIDVPVNLAVKLPDRLDTKVASTVTLGAIAMQGVRRSQPTLGETFVVVGLGILGQLTAQMLVANGCRVIGVDLDYRRIKLALDNGMHIGIDPSKEDYVDRVHKHTGGFGADAVVVTAATESNQVISEAMKATRRKGRVVLVGDVGLDLNRADFYKKELDFLISSSYGPGRYDPVYEEGGQDYPLAYVRWTENRNMQAYIDLLAEKRVSLDSLLHDPYSIEKAADAYGALQGGGDKPLLVLLEYGDRTDESTTKVQIRSGKIDKDRIRVALAGASSFAQGVHLPNMVKLRDEVMLAAVMSRTGANAKAVATQYSAEYCTSVYEDILRDDTIDLVIIATRHDLHGAMVIDALRAGKNVFVEKPLALTEQELAVIEQHYVGLSERPMLLVGYNRRFSPAMGVIKKMLADRTTPMIVNYRMNAGFLPTDHWVHGPEGGGRNIGEACHIYDLFNFLVGTSDVASITAKAISPKTSQWRRNDNFVAIIKYSDGSLCTLMYTALGDKSYPKERMEIFVDGKVLVMDDYKAVHVHGGKHRGWSSSTVQKGQMEELKSLVDALKSDKPWPIPLREQLMASRVSLEVERQLHADAVGGA